MRLLHLASGDLWAGAEVQLFHLSKGLAQESDASLLVVLLNHGQLEQELRNQGVEVIVLDESELSSTSIFRQFSNVVKEFQPDIVHTHRNKENVIGGLAAWLNGKKSIRTVHGASEFAGGLLNFKRFLFDALDKLAALFFQQKIVAVSPELRDKLSNSYALAKLAIIENCVDIEYIENKSEESCPDVRAGNSDGFHIAFVGRFVPVKRVDLFYALAREVIHNQPDMAIHFHMLGDGPLKPDIEAKLEQDDLGGCIHLHGFVGNAAPMLKQMNLLLFTSDHEGLPMTLLEAMALRVPVLSRQLPSIRRVLCEGKCGYFVNSNAIEDFVGTIHRIMSSPDEVKSTADAAYEMLKLKYNIDANVKAYMKLYSEVLWNI